MLLHWPGTRWKNDGDFGTAEIHGTPNAQFAAVKLHDLPHDREALVATLDAIARSDHGVLHGEARLKRTAGVAFLFTGQGSQRPGMGRELLALEPTFRKEIARCDEILRPLLDRSIMPLLEADPDDAAAGACASSRPVGLRPRVSAKA